MGIAIVKEYCVLKSALYMANKMKLVDGVPVYQQIARCDYDILDPQFQYIKSITKHIVFAETAAPAQLSEIEAGFKGTWTDALIAASREVVLQETGNAL
jgi:hypothetical protein